MKQRPDPDGSTPSADDRYEIAAGVVAEPSGERFVVLHAGGSQLSTLSPVGSVIWECLPSTRADLLTDLRNRYAGVATDVLAADLDRFLADLTERGLVVSSNARA